MVVENADFGGTIARAEVLGLIDCAEDEGSEKEGGRETIQEGKDGSEVFDFGMVGGGEAEGDDEKGKGHLDVSWSAEEMVGGREWG